MSDEASNPSTEPRTLDPREIDSSALLEIRTAVDLKTLGSAVVTNGRRLLRADGVCFIIRDGDYCFYVKEDACDPLWTGQRAPLRRCVSGYSILDRQPIAIPDIEKDYRVPQDLYLRTFVRSLIMVPVVSHVTSASIAAIGFYWKQQGRSIHNDEVQCAQSISEATAEAFSRLGLDTETAKSLPTEAALKVNDGRIHRLEVESASTIRTVDHLGERVDDLKETMTDGFRRIDVKLDHLDDAQSAFAPRFVAVEKELDQMGIRREKTKSALSGLILVALGVVATKGGELLVNYLLSLFK